MAMISFYFWDSKNHRGTNLWARVGEGDGVNLFNSAFLEWCEGKNVFFKSIQNDKPLEIPIESVKYKDIHDTNISHDSLYMDEETAIMFKLTWL